GRFGKDIAVFHSKLSDGERYDEWLRIKNKQVKVAIGARSAIFLPFDNLGMIIIDEEHEGSYKSDSNPKYNAREIGELKCNIENCKLVLGSATPSIDTYYRCMTGEIELLTLDNRADGAKLPEVHIVDMREELRNGNKSIFSTALYDGIEKALNNKEQVILFLNRRGFSTFVSCRECGYVFKCNHCDISLTYHSKGDYLSCHYCGEKYKVPQICPKCGSKYVKYFGVGTEKIEKEVKKYFPYARTLRMDFDTTRKKNSYDYIYNTFKMEKQIY
ncbi:primosomal protein N', partial [Clostridium botulinum C str. Eklund]